MSLLRSSHLSVLSICVLLNVAVVTAQTGGNPACYFCDGDPSATLSNPTFMVPIPPELGAGTGLTEISCSNLLLAGQAGFIPAAACATATASDELKKSCGCSNYVAPPVAAPVTVPAPIPIAPVATPVAPIPTAPVSSPVLSPPTDDTPTSEPFSPTSEEPTDATTPTTKGSMVSKEGKKATQPPKEGRNKGTKTPKEPKAKKAPKAVKTTPEDKVPKEPKKSTLTVAAPSSAGIESPSLSPVSSPVSR